MLRRSLQVALTAALSVTCVVASGVAGAGLLESSEKVEANDRASLTAYTELEAAMLAMRDSAEAAAARAHAITTAIDATGGSAETLASASRAGEVARAAEFAAEAVVEAMEDVAMLEATRAKASSQTGENATVLEQDTVTEVTGLHWKKIPQWTDKQDRHHQNLCKNRKLLPQLYLLGVTTPAADSLINGLLGAGVETVGPDCRGWCRRTAEGEQEQELHFFDTQLDWQWMGTKSLGMYRKAWSRLFVDCPQRIGQAPAPQRRVVADFTLDYFRMTELPRGGIFSNNSMAYSVGLYDKYSGPRGKKTIHTAASFTQDQIKDGNALDFKLPQVLRAMYGDQANTRVTFAVTFRNPLAQLRSSYDTYICPRRKNGMFMSDTCQQSNASFAAMLRRDMGALELSPPQFSDWLWSVYYGRQLEDWLTHFQARQFYVIPFANLSPSITSDRICNDLSERLGFEIGCDLGDAKASSSRSSRSSLAAANSGVPMGLLAQFGETMLAETTRLAGVLAVAHQAGAGLAGFDGKNAPKDIQDWLESNW